MTPPPHVVVIFGGNGDLARRKLLPALWRLHTEGLMPTDWRVIGTSRRPFGDDEFHQLAHDSITRFCDGPPGGDAWASFLARLSYVTGEFGPGATSELSAAVRRGEADLGGEPRRLHYLAVPPGAFAGITRGLGEAGLVERARVVFEKPFGVDMDSFRSLNEIAHEVLAEEQIFTIDHYLGKETLQNVLALRFANGMFEPVWNRNHIDHVQIDVPEDLDVANRARFYDATGALRDMVVTHLFQALAVVAMEPPHSFAAKPLLDEKAKVFESVVPLRPDDVVRGQFHGYRDIAGVAEGSETETFIAARLSIDSWRWADVPFFLRTGKRMAESRQAVTLAFREPPHRLFPDLPQDGLANDHLTLELGRHESIVISFLAKRPGPSIRLAPARMTFAYGSGVHAGTIGPYERLIHDALIGDRTLFTRADGIERTWELVEPVLQSPPALRPYAPGSWGPKGTEALVAPRAWHLPDARLAEE